jgi:hypothetical protein
MRRLVIALIVLVSGCSHPAPTTPPGTSNEVVPDATPAVAAEPGGCTSNADCVIYCPAAEGCCSSAPCGCRNAILQSEQAGADAAFAKTCEPISSCPVYDCAYEPAVGAACEDGRCVARDVPVL